MTAQRQRPDSRPPKAAVLRPDAAGFRRRRFQPSARPRSAHMQGVLVDAASVSGAGPRLETADAPRPDSGPDLLERRPVVRRPLVLQEPVTVGVLEGVVHLKPAPVRRVRIRPAALVMVDAVPGLEPRRMVGDAPGGARAPLPDPGELPCRLR